MRRQAGFSLLEVMLAVVLLGLVMGALISLVTSNLATLGLARTDAEHMRLAEQRLRELQESVTAGTFPELGTTQGRFEPPDDDVLWELRVELDAVPLPADEQRPGRSSSLFLPPTGAAPSPTGSATAGSLARAELRLFREEEDPERAEPFILFLVSPPDPALFDALEGAAEEPAVAPKAGEEPPQEEREAPEGALEAPR